MSFLPGANSSEQATFHFKSYMTVNAGPCRLLGCFILSGLNQQFGKDNLRSFNATPVLLLVKVKSIIALTKAYQSPSGKGEVFLANFKLCIQQPHFGKCKLEEKEQSAI